MKKLFLIIAILSLTACSGTYQLTRYDQICNRYEGSPNCQPYNEKEYQESLAICQMIAKNYAINNANYKDNTVLDVFTGAGIGALIGWAADDISPGPGAALGAGIGILAGFLQYVDNEKKAYKAMLIHCMKERGYNVW